MEDIKKAVCQAEDNISLWAEEISDYLFNNPELSDEEFNSSEYLVKKLRKAGFKVTYPYLGIRTSFRAVYSNGSGRTVAFPAEYDALPGYGINHDKTAHACGHNWIAGSTLAAARTLADTSHLFNGNIVVFGTPSEEKSGSKVTLADKGAFDGIDAVLQMHLGRKNCVDTTAMAMTDYVFEFYGKEAHAAKEPENGINALDACHLVMAGINAMRQQYGPGVKVHETITNGGKVPNIIPGYASMWIFVRAVDKDILEKAAERLVNIGKGASLMTGAVFKFQRAKNTFYDIKRNVYLNNLMKSNLASLGITNFTEGDKYCSESTDIGNVSYKCPTCYTTLSTSHLSDAGVHEQGFIEVAGSDGAKKLMHIAAKAMAMTAVDVLMADDGCKE